MLHDSLVSQITRITILFSTFEANVRFEAHGPIWWLYANEAESSRIKVQVYSPILSCFKTSDNCKISARVRDLAHQK